ncbi:hypothetical protein B0A55_11799 [Friedmanniomyces simplex]|uniref:RBR-type E3 ubiquitin transferase n=1 Tax=Friedmanniomyces simplex TaxID=329884 RepID=A0A4U0WG91_9PEZI|nr:hypothetical protein B0A55_11799 [Friedmanniomyces simplex]
MAFWERPCQAMDPLTLSAIIQLQLEDSEHLAANVKGKQREGTVTDAELALQLYTEDLMSTDAVLSDRRMAQSIAMAVIRDGQVIQRAHQLEDQIIRDRDLARGLEADAPAPLNIDPATRTVLSDEQNAWTGPELLAKVTAIYMREPGSSSPTPPALIYDSDSDGTVAESSAWAAARKGEDKPKLGHCVACGEDVEFYEVARVPCDHEYCRPCLAQLFELSMTDETLFPPRCDKIEIALPRVRFFLPSDLVKRFEAKYVELSTKNRVYCYDARCNRFIPATTVNPDNDVATCPDCDRTTCAICKGPSHTGDCPNDTALQQLVNTANTEQWQRCLDCKRFVKLEQGCNHMTCPCGAHFCYVRAAQIVDRNPNPGRRLFAPQHVLHSQPASRRASNASIADTVGGQIGVRGAQVANVASPASSVWQSDFEDCSEWEQDWTDGDNDGDDDDDDDDEPTPAVPTATPSNTKPRLAPPLPVASTARQTRDQRIAEAVEHLRESHECEHDKWRWVKGPHRCEECFQMLPQYIFECRVQEE